MEIWQAIILLLLGFVGLVKGADWFVDGAAGVAGKAKIPQLQASIKLRPSVEEGNISRRAAAPIIPITTTCIPPSAAFT